MMPSPSAASLRIRRKTSAFAPMSMPRLGSSMSRTFGSVSSALPITTFCWFPPESEETGRGGVGNLDRQVLHLAPDDLGLEARLDVEERA